MFNPMVPDVTVQRDLGQRQETHKNILDQFSFPFSKNIRMKVMMNKGFKRLHLIENGFY